MGDRANIYVIDTEDLTRGIYLYTHYSGYEYPQMLATALEHGKSRWSDSQYLTRIVASSVFSDLHGSTTGAGISTTMGDNSYPIIVLDQVNQRVYFTEEGQESSPPTGEVYSFPEFIEFASWPR